MATRSSHWGKDCGDLGTVESVVMSRVSLHRVASDWVGRSMAPRRAEANAKVAVASISPLLDTPPNSSAVEALTALRGILRALRTQSTVADAFRAIAPALRLLTGHDRVRLALFDVSGRWVETIVVDENDVIRSEQVHCRVRPQTQVMSFRADRPRRGSNSSRGPIPFLGFSPEGSGCQSWVSIPLQGPGGVRGTLNLGWRNPEGASGVDIPLLVEICDAMALAEQNSRLLEEVRTSHERQRSLSRRLLGVQEAERRRLAGELHDEIGQSLTALKLMLEMGERGRPAASAGTAAEAREVLNELIARVRDLSLDLRPAMLSDLGVLPTLMWLFGRFTRQTHLRVLFDHHGLDRRFDPEIETAVYRIVQEGLTNVVRHADVDAARVFVLVGCDKLVVEVVDRGKGFDPAGADAWHATSGVSGMRERALLLGGSFEIDAAPGAGVCITAELPIQTER